MARPLARLSGFCSGDVRRQRQRRARGVAFAILTSKPVLAANDFVVI